jgi:hypothetical protein
MAAHYYTMQDLGFLIYLSFLCVISLDFVLSANTNTNLTNYFIETRPFSSCTLHLKSFTNQQTEKKVVEQIVDANQVGNPLWTLWNHNASAYANPSIHVYEACSVNVVIDSWINLLLDETYLIKDYIRFYNDYS